MIQNKNMLVYHTDWDGQRSFRMLPIKDDCPFNEAIYDPEMKILAIVSKEYKEKPQMLPKLDSKGKPVMLKLFASLSKDNKVAEQRTMMETYYEYYLDSEEDIISFINLFAVNPTHDSIDMIFPDPNKESITE